MNVLFITLSLWLTFYHEVIRQDDVADRMLIVHCFNEESPGQFTHHVPLAQQLVSLLSIQLVPRIAGHSYSVPTSLVLKPLCMI